MAGALFTAFFPDQCRLCEQPLEGYTPAPVCAACLDSLTADDVSHACPRCGRTFGSQPVSVGCNSCKAAPPPFDAAASFGVYDGALRRLIHLLKYEKMLPLAGPLAARMACRLPAFGGVDVVVPVPLYWTRQWSRGFNQSALLAKRLAARGGAGYGPRVLKRTRPTAAQAGLSDSQRIKNMRGAFAARRGSRLEGRRVLLVDDVMTTGATLGAAAEALKAAGASYVGALTLARAVRHSQIGASS